MGARRAEPEAQEGPQAPFGAHANQARRALTSEGLPRAWRLARASDLRAVVQQGHRSRTSRLDVYWLANTTGHPRLGVVVPRYRQTAVQRNQLQRRLREASRRLVLPRLPAVDMVIRARPSAYSSAWLELQGDLARWLNDLSR